MPNLAGGPNRFEPQQQARCFGNTCPCHDQLLQGVAFCDALDRRDQYPALPGHESVEAVQACMDTVWGEVRLAFLGSQAAWCPGPAASCIRCPGRGGTTYYGIQFTPVGFQCSLTSCCPWLLALQVHASLLSLLKGVVPKAANIAAAAAAAAAASSSSGGAAAAAGSGAGGMDASTGGWVGAGTPAVGGAIHNTPVADATIAADVITTLILSHAMQQLMHSRHHVSCCYIE